LNVIFNLPLYLKIALLIAALITAWLVLDGPDADPEPVGPMVQRTSDYGMTDFIMTVMGEDGKPSRIIKGSETARYPADDSSEIIHPDTLIIGRDKDDWRIEADRADTQGKGEHIILTGNVIITNVDDPGVQLFTDVLHLDTVHNTAYTDRPVLMTSPQGDTESVGFHAALQERTINLHSRVRGQYNAPAAN